MARVEVEDRRSVKLPFESLARILLEPLDVEILVVIKHLFVIVDQLAKEHHQLVFWVVVCADDDLCVCEEGLLCWLLADSLAWRAVLQKNDVIPSPLARRRWVVKGLRSVLRSVQDISDKTTNRLVSPMSWKCSTAKERKVVLHVIHEPAADRVVLLFAVVKA